jgi:hypothetical protein
MSLDIKTAEELVDRDLEARWAVRRHGPQAELLRCILRAFVERGGPVAVSQVEAAFLHWGANAVREELAALDEQDLILMEENEIPLAYPFSATPTPFRVTLPDGRERFACCATDALGIAAMLSTHLVIRSKCHHCGAPLELAADATGPLDAGDIMVWIGKREEGERRACTSL